MRLVAFAAVVILLIAPESLLSASFQMSFAAVAGLVVFYNAIRPLWSAAHRQAGFIRRAGLYVLGVSLTSIVATLATAPFALFHFQQLAVYGLLANILAMPVLAFVVMPFAVLFFVLLPFGLENLALTVMSWGVDLILEIAHFVAGLEHAVVVTKLWSGELLAVFSLSFVMFLLLEGRLRFIAVIPLAVFLFGISQTKQPDILVSLEAQLIALRQDDGSLSFSNLQKERFVRGQWMQAYGFKDERPQKWPQEGGQGDLLCGELGCRLEREGIRVSFLRDLKGFDDECAWADVVIASDPAPDCERAVKIDRFSAMQSGYALFLRSSGAVVERNEDARGVRPWVAGALF
jgi:competence protein ComEC